MENSGGNPPAHLLWVLGILSELVLVLLPSRLVCALRRRRLHTLPPGRAAVAAYRYSCRLARWGVPTPEVVLECARRAAFGREGPGEEDRAALLAALEGQLTELRAALPAWKRLLLRYGLFLW